MQSSTIGPKLLSMIGPITGMEHVGLGTDGGGRLPALISGYKDVRDLVKLIGAMQRLGSHMKRLQLIWEVIFLGFFDNVSVKLMEVVNSIQIKAAGLNLNFRFCCKTYWVENALPKRASKHSR